MSFVAVAIAGSAVVGGAVALSSSNKANKTAQQAATANNALQTQIYDQNRQTLAPYVQAGNTATNSIQALLGIGGSSGTPTYDFTPGGMAQTGFTGGQTSQEAARAAFDQWRNSTDYGFRKDEGRKSVEAALGRGNMLESGAADKARIRFADNIAAGSFNDYFEKLSGQQRVGLTGASAQAGVGQGFANSVSANNNNAANAAGNASIATGNAVNQALGGVTSAIGYGAGLQSSYGGGSSVANRLPQFGLPQVGWAGGGMLPSGGR